MGLPDLVHGDPTARDLALSHGSRLGRYEILAKWVAAGVRVIVVGNDPGLVLGVTRCVEGWPGLSLGCSHKGLLDVFCIAILI